MTAVPTAIRRLAHGAGLPLPAYATGESAGMDLAAALDADLVLAPGERALLPTGFAIAVPHGFEAQVRPRSGLAAEHGITVLNAPGTVDADYRGEVRVVLVNLGQAPYTVRRGTRIAQLVLAPVGRVAWREADALSDTSRSEGGFGSTGVEGPAPAAGGE